MKKFLLIPILLMAACSGKKPQSDLKETCWASDFDSYHNEYCFTTDTNGVNMDGMLGRGMGDSTRFYPDSIYLNDPVNFTYLLQDCMLVITIPGQYERKFWRKKEGEDIYFVSDFETAYGKEILRQNSERANSVSKAK